MSGTSDEGLIRVLLVDDQELVRSGLRRILRRRDGVVVVGECEDGDQVDAAVREHRPDVVVMDLRMRRVNGIDATTALRARPGAPPVLVLTTFDDDELLAGALRAGASGFLLKDSPAEDVVRGVLAVAAGQAMLDPAVTSRVLDPFRSVPEPAPGGHPPDRARARGAAADGPRAEQRRDRGDAGDLGGDGEEPHRPDLHQARPARPCSRDRLRLRPRSGFTGLTPRVGG